MNSGSLAGGLIEKRVPDTLQEKEVGPAGLGRYIYCLRRGLGGLGLWLKHVHAVEIERKVLVSTTRLLSAEHEEALISAINLAISLLECGQKMEGEQLFRDTLALARGAPGPTHELTPNVLRRMRSLGLTA